MSRKQLIILLKYIDAQIEYFASGKSLAAGMAADDLKMELAMTTEDNEKD